MKVDNYLFLGLNSTKDYLIQNPLHKLLGLKIDDFDGNDSKKSISNPNLSPEKEAFAADLDDLSRLHYLITSRKVTTILEFGVGKSTVIFNNALQINKERYSDFVLQNLRRNDPFECHSIDNSEKWISECKKYGKLQNIEFHHSPSIVSTFNGRVCTFYEKLPNICPDFIYLDAPCYTSSKGDVRGITTNHPDRMPMAGDILSIEHFLLPGTLIVVDGRTANARFLKANLQRNWLYCHLEKFDQHFFELVESPLSKFNKNQIDFCIGDDFYKRIQS